MDTRLIIRLAPDSSFQWALFNRKQWVAGNEFFLPASELATCFASGDLHGFPVSRMQLIVITPGTETLVTAVDVPANQRRRLATVLPYFMEEELADDVADLHFASRKNPQSGMIEVAVTKAALLEQWLAPLGAIGLVPFIVLPETMLVPPNPQGWSLVCDGQEAWFCTSGSHLFAFEAAALPVFLGTCLQETPAISMNYYAIGEAGLEFSTHLKQDYPGITFNVTLATTLMEFFCRQCLDNLPAFTLIQGKFASRNRYLLKSLWKKIAIIIAIWFFGQALLNTGEALYYSWQSTVFTHQSEAVYRELFPLDKKIVNPRQQMTGHLKGGNSPQEGGFLTLMRRISAAWDAGQDSNTAIEAITYNNETRMITLNLKGKSPENFNEIISRLNAQKLTAKALSLTNTKYGTNAQLTVKDNEK